MYKVQPILSVNYMLLSCLLLGKEKESCPTLTNHKGWSTVGP
jgi:hypothetical protein